MICPNCGAENPENATYCTLCYAKFSIPDPHLTDDRMDHEIDERYKGLRLLCPNCQEISPISSQYCLKCGFIFDNIDDYTISVEKQEELSKVKREQKEKELEKILSAPIVVTPESDGTEVMRSMDEALKEKKMARLHARGKEAIAYSAKIIALMSEEMERRGHKLRSSLRLLTEDPLVDLYDLEVEFTLELD